MKTVGIKLADGSFYPVLKEGSSEEAVLSLTTANNNQTKVMVDLYRSRTGTMEDAEYVDSLQIENLVEHPNGEPDISFTVSLDENNELHAKIVDTETGASSNSTITLVSRTVEERLVTDNYDIKPEEPEVPAEPEIPAEPEAPVIEEAAVPTEEVNFDDVTFDDEDQTEAAAVAAMATGVGLLAAAEALRPEEDSPAEDFELPVEDSAFDEALPDIDETPAEEETPDFQIEDTELPDFNEPAAIEETALPDFDETPSPTVESQFMQDDLAAFGGEANADQKADLNDFFGTTEEPAAAPDPEEAIDFEAEESPAFEATDLPDFDDSEFDTNLDLDFDSPVEEAELPDFDNTDLPDFNIPESQPEADEPAPGGISFSGLYDQDEVFDTEDDTEKKTRVPVIICIVCAIICLIAVVLLLFVLPTKYNLINNGTIKPKAKTEKVAPAEPVAEPAPVETPVVEEIPEAKEDEVIIIEKAEEVIPLPPPVAEKPKDITYKIKWGDTLWDISDTYYKNPWRYKYIARYNGIKDPDYIISGTYITIPAE